MKTKRKPVLPNLRGCVDNGTKWVWSEADAELKAAEAVIRAARDHSHAEIEYDPDPAKEARRCHICRALARLDSLTRRPTQRTP